MRMANRVWGNESVLNYLKTGVFHHKPPFSRAMHWEDPHGKPGCDFFGLNHYSRCPSHAQATWNMHGNALSNPEQADFGYFQAIQTC